MPKLNPPIFRTPMPEVRWQTVFNAYTKRVSQCIYINTKTTDNTKKVSLGQYFNTTLSGMIAEMVRFSDIWFVRAPTTIFRCPQHYLSALLRIAIKSGEKFKFCTFYNEGQTGQSQTGDGYLLTLASNSQLASCPWGPATAHGVGILTKECVSLPMYICPWANPIQLRIWVYPIKSETYSCM